MSMSAFEIVQEHLAETLAAGAAVIPEGLTMKFRRPQGPAAGPEGREFSVSGPKADAVRALIFADQGLTRKQISELAQCSVSRVSEVVWGLEYDRVEFPAIPLRPAKIEEPVEPKPGLTPEDDSNPALDVDELIASIHEAKNSNDVEGE